MPPENATGIGITILDIINSGFLGVGVWFCSRLLTALEAARKENSALIVKLIELQTETHNSVQRQAAWRVRGDNEAN